jgi:hypothetical protein
LTSFPGYANRAQHKGVIWILLGVDNFGGCLYPTIIMVVESSVTARASTEHTVEISTPRAAVIQAVNEGAKSEYLLSQLSALEFTPVLLL